MYVALFSPKFMLQHKIETKYCIQAVEMRQNIMSRCLISKYKEKQSAIIL